MLLITEWAVRLDADQPCSVTPELQISHLPQKKVRQPAVINSGLAHCA